MVSVSTGLVSGLDLAGLVDSLISVESNPQTLLKKKLVDTKADAAAYRNVNTKFDALRTAAEALGKAATWAAPKATSSAGSIAVSATSGASPTDLTMTVESVAAAHTLMSASRWTSTTAAAGFTKMTLTTGSGNTTVNLSAGATLSDAVTAINASGAGVKATTVKVADGSYALMLTAASTGANSAFTVKNAGTYNTVTTGSDAVLRLGSATGPQVTSSTNTFTDVVPGTTFTVSQVEATPVTISVKQDPSAVAAAVQTLVDSANAVLTAISGYTDSKSTVAVLKGDSTMRGLASKVLDAVASAVGGTSSASQAGIQLTRYGTVTFDKDTFTKALVADPTLTQSLVNGSSGTPAVPGVAQRLLGVVKEASDSVSGSLVVRANTEDSEATDLQTQIDDWDRRLELRRTTLQAQFTAMETALSSLRNQSTWLSSQLSKLA